MVNLPMIYLFIILIITNIVLLMDRNKYEKPEGSTFYIKNRDIKGNLSNFKFDPNIIIKNSYIEGLIVDDKENITLSYNIHFFIHDIFRFSLKEQSSFYERKEVDDVLIGKIEEEIISVKKFENKVLIIFGKCKLEILFEDFLMNVYKGDKLILSINKKKLFNFEPLPKEKGKGERGTKSLGVDFTFHKTKSLYGLPERTTSLKLPTTMFVKHKNKLLIPSTI